VFIREYGFVIVNVFFLIRRWCFLTHRVGYRRPCLSVVLLNE